jgi:hypothetical protein
MGGKRGWEQTQRCDHRRLLRDLFLGCPKDHTVAASRHQRPVAQPRGPASRSNASSAGVDRPRAARAARWTRCAQSMNAAVSSPRSSAMKSSASRSMSPSEKSAGCSVWRASLASRRALSTSAACGCGYPGSDVAPRLTPASGPGEQSRSSEDSAGSKIAHHVIPLRSGGTGPGWPWLCRLTPSSLGVTESAVFVASAKLRIPASRCQDSSGPLSWFSASFRPRTSAGGRFERLGASTLTAIIGFSGRLDRRRGRESP